MKGLNVDEMTQWIHSAESLSGSLDKQEEKKRIQGGRAGS